MTRTEQPIDHQFIARVAEEAGISTLQAAAEQIAGKHGLFVEEAMADLQAAIQAEKDRCADMVTKRCRQIAFTTTKNGRPVAYRWCHWGMRWFRMGLDEAKLQIATGEAVEVAYTR